MSQAHRVSTSPLAFDSTTRLRLFEPWSASGGIHPYLEPKRLRDAAQSRHCGAVVAYVRLRKGRIKKDGETMVQLGQTQRQDGCAGLYALAGRSRMSPR